jgi:hypothetical protein
VLEHKAAAMSGVEHDTVLIAVAESIEKEMSLP